MWGVLIACSALALAEAPPGLSSGLPGNSAAPIRDADRVWIVEYEAEGASELLIGGDTCATATEMPWPLPPGGYTDTGSTATAGDQYHTNDCNGDDGRNRDVVYKITPTVDTALIITGCIGGSAGTPYDARGWVYEGGCPGEDGFPLNLEPIACSDDGCGDFAGPPHLVFPVTAGVTYYYVQDGWSAGSAGRGSYQIDVIEIAEGPVCDRFNTCTDNIAYADATHLGDRFYIPDPDDSNVPDNCAQVGPCPDVPIGWQCDAGLLFCTGMFCDGINACPTGTAGSPSRISSDFAGGRGGLDNRGFEGFWGLDNSIMGVVVWGEDFTVDPITGLPVANCTKTGFTVTYYADDDGAPGEVLFGPFAVQAMQTCALGGFIQCTMHKYSMAHPPVCLKAGWISVQGQTDPDNPSCEFVWDTTDLTQLSSGRDDNHYWAKLNGEMREYRSRGALMFGLAPGNPPVTGACCDDATATCNDSVECADCPQTGRFAPGTECVGFVPQCGDGACCFADGSCDNTLTQSQCIAQGGVSFSAGMSCAADPANPAGIHCPPANDVCANVSPATGGLPYQFAGRTDGATGDAACPSLGLVVWDAFVLASCQDLVIDYCGTSPTFLGAPFGMLLPGCCDTAGAISACSISNTARIGGCCMDDPPGYEGNYSLTVPHVPAGTWYYPVRSGSGATGDYTLNVSGTACADACISCIGDPEGEPGCSGNNDDCPTAESISCGDTLCGTSGPGDSDWYAIDVSTNSLLTWTVDAEFPVRIRIVDGALGCAANLASLELASESACACEEISIAACVTAGTYHLVVEPQASVAVPCGKAYKATAACAAGCAPAVGACCRFGGCHDHSTQSRCDGLHGHYLGDGAVCASCPALDVADECAEPASFPASRTIPAGNLPGGSTLTYTFRRSELTANPSDPGNNCEGAAAPKDASIWFKWRSGNAIPAPAMHLSLKCEDGGDLGDTLIAVYRDGPDGGAALTCAEIIADPVGTLFACNDESPGAGDRRAELCFPTPIAAATDFLIKVEMKDAGAANEEEEFTLYARSSCTALTCPGTSICQDPPACPSNGLIESEPVCDDNYIDNTNDGCTPGGTINFQPIACGQTYCGQTGNYAGGGPLAERDHDWFIFTITEESQVNWTVQSASVGADGPGITAQIWSVDAPDCSDAENRAAVVNDEDCEAVIASATVGPGRSAVTVLGRSTNLNPNPGDQPCGTPWVGTLTCAAANTLPQPADACAEAPLVTAPGRYSGSLNTNGVIYTADGESQCDGDGGDEGFCDSVGILPDTYLRYKASCTGRVTVDACQSRTPVLLSVHSDCPASCANEIGSGLGYSCISFGCGPGGSRPTLTFDVVQDEEYIVRLAPINSPDLDGPFVLRISKCIEPCFEVEPPPATMTSAISRRANPHAPGRCEVNLLPPRKSEPHVGGIQMVRIGFDIPPYGDGSGATLEQGTCAAPTFVPYSGASVMSGAVLGNEVILTFLPGLENGRTYRISLGPAITPLAGQSVEVRGLAGDVNGDGFVSSTDRSIVVGAWTGPGFTCPTDVDSSGVTTATDRSIVTGAWTGVATCAP